MPRLIATNIATFALVVIVAAALTAELSRLGGSCFAYSLGENVGVEANA